MACMSKYTYPYDPQIHDRGMEHAEQLLVPQFHKLFTGLNIWKFQVCMYVCSDT